MLVVSIGFMTKSTPVVLVRPGGGSEDPCYHTCLENQRKPWNDPLCCWNVTCTIRTVCLILVSKLAAVDPRHPGTGTS